MTPEASQIETDTNISEEPAKTYLVTLTFIVQSSDPVNAQIKVLNAHGIYPYTASAEEVKPE